MIPWARWVAASCFINLSKKDVKIVIDIYFNYDIIIGAKGGLHILRVFKKELYIRWYLNTFKKPLPNYTPGTWIDKLDGKTREEVQKTGMHLQDEWFVHQSSMSANSLSRYLAEEIMINSPLTGVDYQAEEERLVSILALAIEQVDGLIDEDIVSNAKQHLKTWEEELWDKLQ